MKKFFFYTFVIFTFFSGITYSQLVFEENFAYPAGGLYDVAGGNWLNIGTGTRPIQVVEGNLSYPGYNSSSIGKQVFLEGLLNYQQLMRNTAIVNSGSVYVALLISVRDTLNLNYTGASFFSFVDSLSNPKCAIGIRKSSTSGYVKFGVRKTNTLVYAPYDYPINETSLIVLKYKFIPEANNDSLSLWINPPLSNDEPLPDIADISGTDLSGTKGVVLRPSPNSGNIFIDGIRFARSWAEAPLPVQLSSFTGTLEDDHILLKWKTETEVQNYGFDIERKISSAYINEDWKKVGFLQGHGSCNTQNHYYFSDYEIFNFTNYSYRLKQLDINGAHMYSDQVSVEIRKQGICKLYQNYPNPFNPETSIKFSIPEDGNVDISLYDVIGQKVRNVAYGFYNAGDHKIIISSRDLVSGIYFCVMEWGNQRKMMKIAVSK